MAVLSFGEIQLPQKTLNPEYKWAAFWPSLRWSSPFAEASWKPCVGRWLRAFWVPVVGLRGTSYLIEYGEDWSTGRCYVTFEKCHFEERERQEILRSFIAFGTWISPFGRNDKNGDYSTLSLCETIAHRIATDNTTKSSVIGRRRWTRYSKLQTLLDVSW